MLPAVALVGRPNVGKSTLFNRLTGTRDALVADEPGVTRDRRYGLARHAEGAYVVIDTGGLAGGGTAPIADGVVRQVDIALEEADAVVLVVDHREGVTAEDQHIATRLRRAGKPVTVAVNKSEGVLGEIAEAEFHGLGLGAPVAIAARHGGGIEGLLERVLSPFDLGAEPAARREEGAPKLAVIGRPNVGKSTLINRLLGTERLLTSPEPGTTRDSVLVPCERDGQRFTLVDTAGIRRRARVHEAIEKYSVVQSLKAIDESHVVIALLDATEGVTDQDLHLIGLADAQGRALVIGVNKWDGLAQAKRARVQSEVERKLEFVAYAPVRYVAALHGSGIAELIHCALAAYRAAGREFATPRLNEILRQIVQAHPPPIVRGRQVKLRYAHQGGRFPPRIVVHGTQAPRLPAHYRRYLENAFRDALHLDGTPVAVELKSPENPFAGRRNPLTKRQRKRRKRVIRHDRRGR
jgi:GTP-binding protein